MSKTTIGVYDRIRNLGYIAPSTDKDIRYQKMAECIERHNLLIDCKEVDFANPNIFLEQNHWIVNKLQPRHQHINEDKVEQICHDLQAGNSLKRLPIVMLTRQNKYAIISGYHRVAALRKLGAQGHVLIVEDCTLPQGIDISQYSNANGAEDVQIQTEEDIIASFQHTARYYVQKKDYPLALNKEQLVDLKVHLRNEIKSKNPDYAIRSRRMRLGNVVNKIVEDFVADKRYLLPVPLPGKDSLVERDVLIDDQYQEYWPKDVWDVSLVYEEVFQYFTSAETFANAKQQLDTLLENEKNDLFYEKRKDIHVTHWVKFKAGQTLKKTVDAKIKDLMRNYTKLNLNKRRNDDYKIPQVKRLFFPATFAGYASKAYEWNSQNRKFISTRPRRTI